MKTHMSKSPVDLSKFEPRFGNQFGSNRLFYNPRGFWYSCGESWIRHMLKKEQYASYYFYQLDTSKLNICHIKTLADLDAFNKRYFNKEANDLAHIIDWIRVKEDYDGLEICPFITGKYSELFKEIHDTLSFDEKDKISNLLFRDAEELREEDFKVLPKKLRTEFKTLLADNPKYIHRMWCIGWEVASGVIWKNYSKLSLKPLTL